MTKAIEPSEVDLGRELINGATDGLLESALEPRAALGRRKWHFRKVPQADIALLGAESSALTASAPLHLFVGGLRAEVFQDSDQLGMWCARVIAQCVKRVDLG